MKDFFTAFFVQSPFQSLCALEAIHHFGIKKYDFYIPFNDVANSQKIKILLDSYGITYKERELMSNHSLLKFWIKKGKYDLVFVGDYFFCGWGKTMAAAYTKRGGRLFYLDDGIALLKVLSSDFKIERKKDIKQIISKTFLKTTFAFRRIKTNNLFTILDYKSDKYKIVNNEMSIFHPKTNASKKGIYIIGTNSSVLTFGEVSYLDYLTRLLEIIKEKWGNEKVFYCPHRGDKNNAFIVEKLHNMCVSVFDTQVSVEYDFINKGINPHCIFGFNSAALYTLGKIFPQSHINSVHIELKDPYQRKEQIICRNFLESQGIEYIE